MSYELRVVVPAETAGQLADMEAMVRAASPASVDRGRNVAELVAAAIDDLHARMAAQAEAMGLRRGGVDVVG